MNKSDYISMLKQYTYDNSISVYDYYYNLAKKIKVNASSLEDWEKECPFLTGEDYKKLIFSNDEKIEEYFASAMERVFNLNYNLTALTIPSENVFDFSKVENTNTKEESNEITGEDLDKAFEIIDNVDNYSKEDIEWAKNIIDLADEITRPDGAKDFSMEHDGTTHAPASILGAPTEGNSALAEQAAKEDLDEARKNLVNTLKNVAKKKEEDNTSIEENESTNDEALSREDLSDMINDKLTEVDENTNESDNGINREDISDMINDSLTKVEQDTVVDETNDESLSREDITDVVEEAMSKLEKFGIFFTSIGKKIADLLNGFAIVREDIDKTTHLYYHDAKSGDLSGRTTYTDNELDVKSGYYVNYQEYVDEMLNSIIEQYPDATKIDFITEKGDVQPLNEVISGAFNCLRDRGSIRFGEGVNGASIKSYDDLRNLNLEETNSYNGNELKQGVYVRRDILNKIFTRYKVRVTIDTKDNNEEINRFRSK